PVLRIGEQCGERLTAGSQVIGAGADDWLQTDLALDGASVREARIARGPALLGVAFLDGRAGVEIVLPPLDGEKPDQHLLAQSPLARQIDDVFWCAYVLFERVPHGALLRALSDGRTAMTHRNAHARVSAGLPAPVQPDTTPAAVTRVRAAPGAGKAAVS